VVTRPDLLLKSPRWEDPVVVDAKYKATDSARAQAVSSADVYEMLAFLKASDSRTAILLYPSDGMGENGGDAGTVEVFDVVDIPPHRVFGVRVSTSGVGRAGGLADFGRSLGRALVNLAEEGV
jgi:hypothetical protein